MIKKLYSSLYTNWYD